MDLRKELVTLYARDNVAAVEASREFAALVDEHGNVEGFEAERLRIRGFKGPLEDALSGQTHPAQVRLCLRLLADEQNEDDRADHHDLVQRYRDQWNDSQKAHFDHAYGVLTGNVYFFLSFTTRSHTVNKENRYFIEEVFWPETPSNEQWLSENLLAAAVHKYLTERGIKGFYYPTHAGQSNDVIKKLTDNANAMLTFVQIVQGAMFDDKDPNFCHFEYEQALSSPSSKKRIYVLGEERADIEARKNSVSKDFREWFNEVFEKVDPMELASTRFPDDDAVKNNHDDLKKNVVREIERLRDELFDSVPG